MPTTNPFASLFRRSPFTVLQEHMRVVVQCVDEVPGLFEALTSKNRAEVEAIKDRIFALEEQADQIKNQLREHLPRSLFMPVDRRDLLDVLDMQDSIADVSQDIAGLLVERSMVVPEPMTELLLPFVHKCVAVCHHSAKIIDELDELLATGFKGKEASQVDTMIGELNRLEDETDQLGIALTGLLFQHEDEMNPVSVIFWYRLIEWIGDLADYAEKVGNRLRLLIAR